MTALTSTQLDAFEHDGFLAPLPLLSATELSPYRVAAQTLLAQHDNKLERIDKLHLDHDWARELGSHPRLLDHVAALIGEDLLIHGTLMLCKFPGRPGSVPWHQDSVYSGWHLSPTVSAWIALTPSNGASGCMRVIAGSHHNGVLTHQERPQPGVLLKRGETVVDHVDASRAQYIELEPGQFSLHHCNLVHGSQANISDQPRIGFIIRFVTSAHRSSEGSLLRVRGQGDDRHLNLIP